MRLSISQVFPATFLSFFSKRVLVAILVMSFASFLFSQGVTTSAGAFNFKTNDKRENIAQETDKTGTLRKSKVPSASFSDTDSNADEDPNTSRDNGEALPKGYGGVLLGMSVDDAKDALKHNSDFGYRGERDVRLTPGEERTLIETDAKKTYQNPFLDRCTFQFSDESLYIISIGISSERMDYFTLFDTLCKKYGNPTSLNPNKAIWTRDNVSMSLERPLTIRYIDDATFRDQEDKSATEKSGRERARDMFLEDF